MCLRFNGKFNSGKFNHFCRLALLASLLLSIIIPAAKSSEDWQLALDYQERMRVIELTRNLDATYMRRREVVNEFVKLGRGPNSKLVREQLLETLPRGNLLVRQSVMEIMARIGSPDYVETLAEVLPFEMFHQNRLILLRLLPSFLVRDDQYRQSVVDALYGDDSAITDWLREMLRRDPLEPSGRELDRQQAQLRQRIITALAGQLDPIGSALQGYETKRYNTVAREFVFQVLQESMLGSRHESLETWMFLRPNARLKDAEAVGEIQESACRMLVEIGATEACKEILALGYVKRPEAQEMALASLVKLSLYAHLQWAENEAILNGPGLRQHDIFDWQDFLETFSACEEPAAQPVPPALLKIWQAFPNTLREAIMLSNQAGNSRQEKLTEADKASIIAILNKIISNPSFAREEKALERALTGIEVNPTLIGYDENLSDSLARHRNRLLLEKLFPLSLRRHSSWRELKAPEEVWRKEQQKFCEQTVASAYELATNLLEDENTAEQDEVRLQAYQALGVSKKPAAIEILRNDALRVGTSPRMRSKICWALGEIGGVEAVSLLGQLSQYKGYSLRSLDRRDEYKQVCAAVQALGRILARWDDPGTKPALEELLRLMVDRRTIPELPDLPSISEQSLYELQKSLQIGSSNLTPLEWRDYQKKFYLEHAGNELSSIRTK
ncbi:MAG: HEAT repeat domain-containing protein [Planctomycetes bacterium]|nr:HEAT repeat domain-containing protein [Planctomycetota bacterium]